MFNDVYSCPRCKTIMVYKDGVTLTWSGKIALVLLDQAELYITKLLLEHRHECDRATDAPVVDDTPVVDGDRKMLLATGEKVPGGVSFPTADEYRKMLLAAGKKVTECVNCNFPVEDKCGAECLSCRTLQPCGTER